MSIFKKKKISVYFIAQYKQGIDKFYNVVKGMEKDPGIDVKVIAFPNDINNFPNNNDYEYWEERFGNITINSIDNGKWFNLKDRKPDYVFVQRIYDNYLPGEYSLACLASYTKVCYIPYGYSLHNCHDITLPPSVLKNINLFFAESTSEQNYAQNEFNKFNDGIKRESLYVGYPFLDEVWEFANNQTSAFKKIKVRKDLNLIYTPRWTTDAICGTSFFKYKDAFLNLSDDNYNIVFRPHPLMFDNFINKKLMKKSEVNTYIKELYRRNIYYDSNEHYLETFKESDVLITDFSSIIIEYLLFNKPIIFLETDESHLNDELKKLKQIFYCANNWNDVTKYLKMLSNGKDPLKEKREEYIEVMTKTYDGHVCDRLIKVIKDKYKEK